MCTWGELICSLVSFTRYFYLFIYFFKLCKHVSIFRWRCNSFLSLKIQLWKLCSTSSHESIIIITNSNINKTCHLQYYIQYIFFFCLSHCEIFFLQVESSLEGNRFSLGRNLFTFCLKFSFYCLIIFQQHKLYTVQYLSMSFTVSYYHFFAQHLLTFHFFYRLIFSIFILSDFTLKGIGTFSPR